MIKFHRMVFYDIKELNDYVATFTSREKVQTVQIIDGLIHLIYAEE